MYVCEGSVAYAQHCTFCHRRVYPWIIVSRELNLYLRNQVDFICESIQMLFAAQCLRLSSNATAHSFVDRTFQVLVVAPIDDGIPKKNSIELNKLARMARVQLNRERKTIYCVGQWCNGCDSGGAAPGVRTKFKRHSISLAIFAFVGTPFFFTAGACFDVQAAAVVYILAMPPMFPMLPVV